MKKILFTGGTGLLGKYFLSQIPRDYFVYATYSKNVNDIADDKRYQFLKLDVGNKQEIRDVFASVKPDVVVHAASLGNVDYCEQHKDEARKINVLGTRYMLQYAEKYKAKFIFTSTNAVYDGKNPPFHETDQTGPVDYYGKTKIQSEKDIISKSSDYVIVRLMTMYGWNNPHERMNPVSWLIDRLQSGKKTPIVTDIFNNYLYAGDGSKAIWKIIMQDKKNEVYNVASKKCISRFALAVQAAKVFGYDQHLIDPVTSDYFPSIAPRPKNTCFVIDKMVKELQMRPLSITKGLLLMKNESK